jgi:hypothetical protein
MERICDLEANYTFCLEKWRKNPTAKGEAELAQKQLLIDKVRRSQKEPQRWYTRAELKEMDEEEQPTTPRTPYDLTEEWVEVPPKKTTVKVDGTETMTLDALIARLQELREEYDGDTPVWHVEFGGITELLNVSEDEEGIVLS